MDMQSSQYATQNIEVGVGISDPGAGPTAGRQATEAALASIHHNALSAVLVYASPSHDLGRVLADVKGLVGQAPIIGCTTAGELFNGMHRHSVVVVALASEFLTVRAAVGEHVSRDWQAAVDSIVSSSVLSPFIAPTSESRLRRVREGKRLFALLFSPGNTRHATSRSFEVLRAIKSRTLGEIPIFAGSSADDWGLECNAVFFGDHVYPDGMLFAVFETSLSFGVALGHGFVPTETRMRVSAVDSHEVVALDDRPALEVLADKLGTRADDLLGKHIALSTKHTLGTPRLMGQYSINIATFATERGGVNMSQPLEPNDELVIMSALPDATIACAGDTLRKALLRADTSRAAIVLCNYCALRPRLMGEQRSAAELQRLVAMAGDAPVAGFSSFGEGGLSDDGISLYNNASVSVLVIGHALSPLAHVAHENERLRQQVASYANHLERLVEARTSDTESARQMLQTVLDTIPVRVFWKDLDLNYLGCNQLFAADAGFQHSQQLVGRSDFEMSWRKEAEQYRADDRAVIEDGEPQIGYEEPQTRPNGEVIWLRTSKIPLKQTHTGEIIGILGAYEDITDRRRAEQALRVAQDRAEQATQAKSAFLANTSHEIRTPLSAITGMVHLLKRSELTPEQSHRLDQIDQAGQHLLEIINAVLDLSKIEAEQFTLEDTRVDLNGLINTVTAIVRDRANSKGLRLIIDAPALPAVSGDPLRLQQMLLNYVGNAIKFTAAGAIILRARVERDEGAGLLVRLAVEDTGIGIEPDVIPKLFSAFEQAEASITRQYGGTGLGLAINKRLAKLMGGEVGVTSTPGQGSCFWLTARLRKASAPIPSSSLASEPSAETLLPAYCAGRRILVAEDEPINREVILSLIEDLGLEIAIAHDGVEAVQQVERHCFDLILMDMQMPHLNGLDATRQIRTLPNGKQVPILAFTANAFNEDRVRCLEAGMNDFVSKPVEPDTLFAILLKWLRTRSS